MGNSESAPEQPEPQQAPAPAPAPPPPVAPAAQQQQQFAMVSVRCPPGTGPGDTVRIPHGGQMFDVKAPAGVAPGGVFQVQLPVSQSPAPQAPAGYPGAPAAGGGGIYSGTGAAYPGLQSAAAAAPQSAAARARMPQSDVLSAVAPPPAPTATVRSQKLQMSLALVAGSVKLEGGTLACTLDLGVPARLAAWQGVPLTPKGAQPPLPAELGALAAAGAPGEAQELQPGESCAVSVELDTEAIGNLRAEAAGQQLCPVVLCLEATEPPPPDGVTVRALIVWLDYAGSGGGSDSPLQVRAQHIFTSTGQVIPVETIFGANDGEGDASSADGGMCVVCYDGPKDTAVLPCKHLCACADCAPALRACPICRQPAEGYLQLKGIAGAGEGEGEGKDTSAARGEGGGEGGGGDSAQPPPPVLDPSLPYGGDLQAAMRAQDRDAIRLLMERQSKR